MTKWLWRCFSWMYRKCEDEELRAEIRQLLERQEKTTKTLEGIVLTRKRRCCKCGKTMQPGEVAMKYTCKPIVEINLTKTRYWCEKCEKQAGKGGQV